jgi:DNA replication protein DnaC
MEMKDIIGKIKERELFPTIRRFQYMPYNMSKALSTIEFIGKSRNSNFVIDDDNKFTFENLIRWVHGDSSMMCINPVSRQVMPARLNAGIYIAGNTGTGKSWILEIMSAYCLIDNVQFQSGNTKRCLHWGNVRTDAICDEYVANGTFEKYKRMSIVGIQDFGAEPAESMYMGNRVNVLRQIIEYRGDFTDKMTLITSNLPINHNSLVNRYGDRVASRLNQMCNYFELKGKDRRKL